MFFRVKVPLARQHFSFIPRGNEEEDYILFGGQRLPDNKAFNDVWIFNYQNAEFDCLSDEVPGCEWTLLETSGEIPSPRYAHCAAVYKNSLIMFGGKSMGSQVFQSQIYQLSLKTLVWIKVQGIGRPPSPRMFFSDVVWDESRIIIFGGILTKTNDVLSELYQLDLDDFHWSLPFSAGVNPGTRYNHAACFFKDPENNF